MERTNFGMVLAKIEAVYSTDSVPTAQANLIAIRRSGLSFSPKFSHLTREILDGSLSKLTGKNVPEEVDFTLEVEMRGNRTDGVAPDISSGKVANILEIDPLLQACDLAPTYTSETGAGLRDGYVVYKPTVPSDEGKSVTIYFYTGAKLHKLTGCKGNLKGSMPAGQFGVFTFEMKGIYNNAEDAAIPANPTWLATKPPLVENLTTIIGIADLTVSKIDFDLGNNIQRRPCVTGPYGQRGFVITDRTPKLSIDPEAVTEATHPIWGDIEAATARSVRGSYGADAGNKVSILITGVPSSVGYGDRTGLRTNTIDFVAERASFAAAAGNEFQLHFS